METNSSASQNLSKFKRLRAVELHEDGMKAIRISEVLEVTRGAVSQWLKRYREQGIESLYYKRIPRKPCRLSQKQLDKLLEMLNAGAENFGYTDNVWTDPRIRDLIEVKFGIKYCLGSVEKLIKKWGWTPQKPETCASQ